MNRKIKMLIARVLDGACCKEADFYLF